MAARYPATEPRVPQRGTSPNRGWGSCAHDAGDTEPARCEPRPPIAATCGPEHASHVPIAKGGNRMSNTRPRGRLLHLLMPIAVLAMILAACGGGTSSILSTVGDSVDAGGESYAAASAAPVAEAPAAAPEAAGQTPDRSSGQAPSAPRDDLKIVYTGSLELVVDDLQASLAKARTAVLATGGYIGASQEANDGDRSVATITYRVPAARWEDALASLRGLATEVVGERTQATEVGGQLVDIEARLRNLRASEQVLVDIAKGTGKVTDLLEVEARIADVRGQIEQLDGQRLQLQDQVALGTLVATFGTEVVQVQETAKGWDPDVRRGRRDGDPDRRRPGDRLGGDLVRHRLAAGHPRPAAVRADRPLGVPPVLAKASAGRPGPGLGRRKLIASVPVGGRRCPAPPPTPSARRGPAHG